MKSRPILFSGTMVRAILDGRKTQTRRVVKGAPVYVTPFIGRDNQPTHEFGLHYTHERVINKHVHCPYGQPGDRLWVRETWGVVCGAGRRTVYRADGDPMQAFYPGESIPMKWTPSIHMPRWASRLTLEVVNVRVERLQAISEADARAEGFAADSPDAPFIVTARDAFRHKWLDLYGAESWNANPWVWVVKFKRVS